MKKWGPPLFIFLAGVLIGTVVGWRGYEYHRNNWLLSERRYPRMIKLFSKKLDLSLDQTAKLTVILDDKRKKMEALRADVHPKFDAIRQTTREEIRQILRPDQIEKFNQLEARWDARRKKRNEPMP